MATGVLCTATPSCRSLATPEHPACSRCQRERRLAAMRESPSAIVRVLARVLPLLPHRDLELDLKAGA
jgi:hypothetical protein